jgi:hypothetical protein
MEYVKTKPCLKRIDNGVENSFLYPNRIECLLEMLFDSIKSNKAHLCSEKHNISLLKVGKNMYDISVEAYDGWLHHTQYYSLKIENIEIENLYTLSKINMKLAIDSILYDPYEHLIKWSTSDLWNIINNSGNIIND